MAENMFDNPQVQEAGLPRIPIVYEKAMRMLNQLVHYMNKSNDERMALRNDLHSKEYRDAENKTLALEDLYTWMLNAVKEIFAKKDIEQVGLERRKLWRDDGGPSSPINSDFSWIVNPAPWMGKSPLESALALTKVNSKLNMMRDMWGLYQERKNEMESPGFKERYPGLYPVLLDSQKKRAAKYNLENETLGSPYFSDDGDVKYDMWDRVFGNNLNLDPLSGYPSIDSKDIEFKPPWYESGWYEKEEE